LAALAIALNVVSIDASLRIAFFAFTVLAFSIIWPHLRNTTLQKDLVDFVYYSAAIALAALVFFASGAERKKTDLSASISQSSKQLSETVSAVNMQLARYAALENVLADPQPFQIWLDHLTSMAMDSREMKDMAFPCGCADHPKLPGACGQMSVNKAELNAIDTQNVRAAREYCDDLRRPRGERFAKDQTRNAPREMTEIARIVALLQVDASKDIEVASVKAPILASWIIDSGQAADKENQNIRSALEQLTSRYSELDTSIRKDSAMIAELAISSRSDIGLLASEIKDHYWPFVLISLLGLKFARMNYVNLLDPAFRKR
jgi:hypothetical protein